MWLWLALLLFAITAHANTEKVIFLAPPAVSFPNAGPTLEDLHLTSLHLDNPSLRTKLHVTFPNTEQRNGFDSWFLLDDLTELQRYEVRVCWAATQPTAFTIDTFGTQQVFDNPELIQSLAAFSENVGIDQANTGVGRVHSKHRASVLFLRVQAAADFFSTNKTLMLHPPPVDVDIILDPYRVNIFPQSLTLTAGYIVLLAGGACINRFEVLESMDFTQHGGGIPPDDPGTNQQQRATPQHPFYSLPSELILDIVDLLPPESFINFAFANYPLLHSYGLAPALSRPRVVYITTQTQIPALFPLLNLPPEIMLHVMRNLKPIDIMRFTVANYQDLARQGIAPSLGEETVQQLRNAVRARLAPG
ncbi:hypothetical protein D0867_11169 [Hortaea werneckii]|uniref:F-box domain-containing protein n=1 Tax=Hortaea werneckii TaxID=91943 RepID=A0A3M6YGU3_HORWE|nr:hypothetical protein D0867_11169 [Hortaea werneckii]RMY22313.1 hypothetical protein D0866_11975 [Hortaea werneckii]